jgi:CRISPR system Cascade subunit CasD
MKEMRMTVYVIRYPQRIEDFQTIGGGYDKKKQRENIPRRADGSTGATVISRREYLADGKFGVQLSGAAENLAQIEKALKDPKWGIWFGRKSCIPSVPVCWGVFDEQEKLKEKLIEETGESPKKVIRETTRFSDGTDTIMDVPLDFNKRIFAVRRVSDI